MRCLQYVFIFFVGSYRVWTLLRVPTAKEFPYSTRHSVKVMILGWLGLMPMIVFAFRYAEERHDDFEWVSVPLLFLEESVESKQFVQEFGFSGRIPPPSFVCRRTFDRVPRCCSIHAMNSDLFRGSAIFEM